MAESFAAESKLHALVVVGASAGGIEALATLVATLPANFPAPIVLAQHLDPRHPSHLDEILARHSRLLVRIVTDHMPLEPGVVYVVPPDRHVEVDDHLLRLRVDGTEQRPKPSINRLLSSAARAFGEQLIAVILTGSGSDGASGAHEVKAAGGMVIIENPQTAAYPAMPASLAPVTVDLVADLERIGPLLYEILNGAGLPASEADDEPALASGANAREQALQTLLTHVRERSGVDFAQYKRPTILRRLQRRMAASGAADLAAYTAYLERHPEEYHQLIGSFLIKLTEFFRDPKLFAVLRDEVLPDLIAQARQHGNVLRIWSAGCATGEEPYSLAILVSEALGEELEQFRVQIFATDLDEDAVEFARRGIYTAAALKHVAPELATHYFTRLDGSFQVMQSLRRLVIFGLHDLGLRAPFPHIDLVICRNVLIYFTQELQSRAFELFAFSLRDGGYLVLGNAETARPFSAYFEPAHRDVKLYRRQGERILAPLPDLHDLQQLMMQVPRTRHLSGRPEVVPPSAQRPTVLDGARTVSERLGRLVLDLPVGVAVVDRHYDIQVINGAALRMLGIYTAAVGEDLIHLAQTIPATALRSVIDAAFRGVQGPAGLPETLRTPQTSQARGRVGAAGSLNVRLEAVVTVETLLGERRQLQITCYPYTEGVGATQALEAGGTTNTPPSTPPRPAEIVAALILISDVTHVAEAREQAAGVAARELADLQALQAREQSDREHLVQQLQEENVRLKAEVARQSDINRTLLEANQDLADTSLALRTTNQELLISQEEAEASAEEVKTLNEELQSANEELVTVNEELEAGVEELHTANDELQAGGQELQEMAASLEAQRVASEAERAQLRAIVRSMSDALLVVDAAGRPVLANDAYAQLFGSETATLAPEDETGRPLPSSALPQQRAARGEIFVMTFTLPGAAGARRRYEASGQRIHTDDAVGGGVITFREISEQVLSNQHP